MKNDICIVPLKHETGVVTHLFCYEHYPDLQKFHFAAQLWLANEMGDDQLWVSRRCLNIGDSVQVVSHPDEDIELGPGEIIDRWIDSNNEVCFKVEQDNGLVLEAHRDEVVPLTEAPGPQSATAPLVIDNPYSALIHSTQLDPGMPHYPLMRHAYLLESDLGYEPLICASQAPDARPITMVEVFHRPVTNAELIQTLQKLNPDDFAVCRYPDSMRTCVITRGMVGTCKFELYYDPEGFGAHPLVNTTHSDKYVKALVIG